MSRAEAASACIAGGGPCSGARTMLRSLASLVAPANRVHQYSSSYRNMPCRPTIPPPPTHRVRRRSPPLLSAGDSTDDDLYTAAEPAMSLTRAPPPPPPPPPPPTLPLQLIQIQKQHEIIDMGAAVLDLGCAPGAWLQVACTNLGPLEKRGVVVGVDVRR